MGIWTGSLRRYFMKLENIKKMVLIVDEYPFPIGGMETHAYEFIKFFSQQNAVNFIGVIAFSSTLKKQQNQMIPVDKTAIYYKNH